MRSSCVTAWRSSSVGSPSRPSKRCAPTCPTSSRRWPRSSMPVWCGRWRAGPTSGSWCSARCGRSPASGCCARPDLMRSRELLAVYLTASCRGLAGPAVRRRRRPRAGAVRRRRRRHRRRRRLGPRVRTPGDRRRAACSPAWTAGSPPAARTRRWAWSCGSWTTCRSRPPRRPGCWPPPPCSPTSSATTTRHVTYGARWPWPSPSGTATAISASTARTFLGAELMFSGELADGLALAARGGRRGRGARPLPALGPGPVPCSRWPGPQRGLRRRAACPRGQAGSRPREGRPRPDRDCSTPWRRSRSTTATETRPARSPSRRSASPASACRRSCATRPSRLARAALAAGRPRRGRPPGWREALDAERPPGADASPSPSACESAACLAAARGEADTAVRLFAAAQSLSPSPGGGDVPPRAGPRRRAGRGAGVARASRPLRTRVDCSASGLRARESARGLSWPTCSTGSARPR